MRTFEYVAVTILGLIFAAWLATSVATSIGNSFAKATAQIEHASNP